jgi:hypothetical protein
MNKVDLDKLIRIAETVRDLSTQAVKIGPGNILDAFGKSYKSYYELIKPIFGRYLEYQLEFQSLTKAENISYMQIIPSFIALSSFLDGVIKQEAISNRTAVDQIKKEFFYRR